MSVYDVMQYSSECKYRNTILREMLSKRTCSKMRTSLILQLNLGPAAPSGQQGQRGIDEDLDFPLIRWAPPPLRGVGAIGVCELREQATRLAVCADVPSASCISTSCDFDPTDESKSSVNSVSQAD